MGNDDAVDEDKLVLCCALCCVNASFYPTCDCFGCSGKVRTLIANAFHRLIRSLVRDCRENNTKRREGLGLIIRRRNAAADALVQSKASDRCCNRPLTLPPAPIFSINQSVRSVLLQRRMLSQGGRTVFDAVLLLWMSSGM